MKIHEYQAKQILRQYGVPLLAGQAATSPESAVNAARDIGGDLWVVKSQIHAGGRGMGRFKEQVSEEEIAKAARGEKAAGEGGVRLCRSTDEVAEATRSMLGSTLVTKQTGIEGKTVRTVFVEAGCDIARELYLSMLLDRAKSEVMIMASASGGMSIEDVAAKDPDAIKKAWIDPAVGFSPYQGRRLAYGLGIEGKTVRAFTKFVAALYEAYRQSDASMVEVNPLVITGDGEVVALDAKMTFDDNSLYRHKDIAQMRDPHEEDPTETEASKWKLSFVALDGNIGCMVNGAGLAMSTMDIIKLKGAEPANFLDVGGSANQEQVAAAFRIITSEPAVKGILVNIFGGIMKCDVIAQGVVAAVKEVGLEVPLVVRLAGTNVELGKKILADSGLAITPASTLDEAADAIVAAVQG